MKKRKTQALSAKGPGHDEVVDVTGWDGLLAPDHGVVPQDGDRSNPILPVPKDKDEVVTTPLPRVGDLAHLPLVDPSGEEPSGGVVAQTEERTRVRAGRFDHRELPPVHHDASL